MFAISSERLEHAAAISHLHHVTFGPGRWARSGYLVREAAAPDPDLSAVATDGPHLLGSVRFTPMGLEAGGTVRPVLLLGPLAVASEMRGQGVGGALMAYGLGAAADQGHDLVFLLGSASYYARFGFAAVPPRSISLELPFDETRLLWRSLAGQEQALCGVLRTAYRDSQRQASNANPISNPAHKAGWMSETSRLARTS